MQIIHLCSHTKSNCQFVFLFLTLKVICLQIICNELFILLPQEAIGSPREPLSLLSLPRNLYFSCLTCSSQEKCWGAAQPGSAAVTPVPAQGSTESSKPGQVFPGLRERLAAPGSHQLALIASLAMVSGRNGDGLGSVIPRG